MRRLAFQFTSLYFRQGKRILIFRSEIVCWCGHSRGIRERLRDWDRCLRCGFAPGDAFGARTDAKQRRVARDRAPGRRAPVPG